MDVCDYDTLKEALLSALGLTVADCCRDFWQPKQYQVESTTDLAVHIKRLTARYAEGCDTFDDLVEQILLGHFLSKIPVEVAAEVWRDHVKTTTEAARMADSLIKDRNNYWDNHWSKPTDGGWKRGQDRQDQTGKPEQVGSVIPTIMYRKDTSMHGEKMDSGLLSLMKCYSCGQKGHRKADCLKQVAQVLSIPTHGGGPDGVWQGRQQDSNQNEGRHWFSSNHCPPGLCTA